MGCGWGSFVEYAGRQGIEVHAITISREQQRFVQQLIARERLPCRVELVDFLDYRPDRSFAGAVFMGTFEHFQDYAHAARFLARHLAPGARVWADFCSERGPHRAGAFLARHIFPGSASYVDLPRLVRALERAGLSLRELVDDTASYAHTVRDWADAFEAAASELAARFGEPSVRAFRLFLRASQYYLERRKTLAYHLVAGVEPRGRRSGSRATLSRAASTRTLQRSRGSARTLEIATLTASAVGSIPIGSGAAIEGSSRVDPTLPKESRFGGQMRPAREPG
jgi:cyclopropane-fatty-acyl-phospholipid synthase